MAVTARKSVASLMKRTMDKQASVARMKFKLKENQVQNILRTYLANNVGPYNDLIEILKLYPLSDENFKVLFQDCMACVVLLGREFKPFVSVICDVEWTNKSEENVELYSMFLLDLVTTHIYHSSMVIASLVKLFRASDGENWDVDPTEENIIKWSHIHKIIAQMVAVMPMSSSILMQTIIDQFPYYKAGVFANRAYIHNLIWITKYIPSLLEQIITAIINRMVTMDVNLEERAKAQQQELMFSMEVEDPESELAETLDHCMVEVLHWIQDEKDPAWQTMCFVFERIILPTFGIRHVQFLLLYTISISQQCADRVLDNLWKVMAGIHGLGPAALATRRTAAAHLAGLLARCVRMPNSRLVRYLKSMADWCHSYVTATRESSAALDNEKVHGAFNAICHAVFYLVAFKHQQLFGSKESIIFVESLNLPRLVTCGLNPLRGCPEQVARAFSSVTRAHQLVYCQAIIERNARQTLQRKTEQLDDWFPYDPYTLPSSGKVIWPLCIEYKGWSKSGDDQTQFSSRMKKLESEDDDYLMASPAAKLASSLSNCVSPGFKSM